MTNTKYRFELVEKCFMIFKESSLQCCSYMHKKDFANCDDTTKRSLSKMMTASWWCFRFQYSQVYYSRLILTFHSKACSSTQNCIKATDEWLIHPHFLIKTRELSKKDWRAIIFNISYLRQPHKYQTHPPFHVSEDVSGVIFI